VRQQSSKPRNRYSRPESKCNAIRNNLFTKLFILYRFSYLFCNNKWFGLTIHPTSRPCSKQERSSTLCSCAEGSSWAGLEPVITGRTAECGGSGLELGSLMPTYRCVTKRSERYGAISWNGSRMTSGIQFVSVRLRG
jgi:hypothetical protein